MLHNSKKTTAAFLSREDGKITEKEHLSKLLIAPSKFPLNNHIDHKLLLREQFMVSLRKTILGILRWWLRVPSNNYCNLLFFTLFLPFFKQLPPFLPPINAYIASFSDKLP